MNLPELSWHQCVIDGETSVLWIGWPATLNGKPGHVPGNSVSALKIALFTLNEAVGVSAIL